jgi:hypothetical protein
MKRLKRRDRTRGQSMVEFALTLPIFLLLLVSVFDLGHVVWANNAISTAAREGARYAVVHGGTDSVRCPQGPLPSNFGGVPDPAATCGFAPSTLSPYVESREGIRNQVARWLSGSGAATISVCYGNVTTCSNDVDAVGATNVRGTKVTVTVTTTIGLAAPALVGINGFTLSATSTMLVNH